MPCRNDRARGVRAAAHRDVSEQDQSPVKQQLQFLLRLPLVAGTQLHVQELGNQLRWPVRGEIGSVGPQRWSEVALEPAISFQFTGHVTEDTADAMTRQLPGASRADCDRVRP